MYKAPKEVERFRRIFSRFEKLDLVFLALLFFVLVVDGLCRS